MKSTSVSTQAPRGVVGARLIKLPTRANSPHVQFSKAVSRPLRLRPAAGRFNVVSYYGRDPRSRQGSNNFDRQNRKDSGNNDFRRRRSPPSRETIQIVVREYAVPAIGVFALATILGPLIGAVAFSAFGVALAIAATVAAFSLSWIFIPVILSFMGLPLLFGGGLATSIFAGAAGVLLFPTLLQIGLITAALWLGTSVARAMWYSDDLNDDGDLDRTIDVEADTIDSIEREMEMEAKRREEELREFDELLRRRERFQRGGGGGGSSGSSY